MKAYDFRVGMVGMTNVPCNASHTTKHVLLRGFYVIHTANYSYPADRGADKGISSAEPCRCRGGYSGPLGSS